MAYRMFPCMAAAAVAGWVATLDPFAYAQSPADFYKGKNVDLFIGYSVGGGYDLYARVLARHIGQHIPGNPTIVVKNMEGAGSLRLANWLYRVAPKDGSVFAIIGRGTGFEPLLEQQAAQFDGTKFTWIGSGNHEVSVCVLMATARASRNSPISRPRR
jgi:tripartite-type tricarboxylate transporter receptor subunit TctC